MKVNRHLGMLIAYTIGNQVIRHAFTSNQVIRHAFNQQLGHKTCNEGNQPPIAYTIGDQGVISGDQPPNRLQHRRLGLLIAYSIAVPVFRAFNTPNQSQNVCKHQISIKQLYQTYFNQNPSFNLVLSALHATMYPKNNTHSMKHHINMHNRNPNEQLLRFHQHAIIINL